MELSAAGAGDLGRAKQLPAGRERRRRAGTAPGAEAGKGLGMVVVDTAWVRVVVTAGAEGGIVRKRGGAAAERSGKPAGGTLVLAHRGADTATDRRKVSKRGGSAWVGKIRRGKQDSLNE